MTSDLSLDAISVVVLDFVDADTVLPFFEQGSFFEADLHEELDDAVTPVTFRTGDKGSPVFCGNEKGEELFFVSGRVFISRCPWKTKIP